MWTRALLAGILVALCAADSAAQNPIFIVRHAERGDGGAGGMVADPDLSAAGRARARSLAGMLKDTKLQAVFATEFKRTQQTAGPTAASQQLTVSTVPSGNTTVLIQKLRDATGPVLVVGHSNTVSEVIAGLGVKTPVKLEESEFDNLFIVVMGTEPRLVRLRYK